MAEVRYLVDTSVLGRASQEPVGSRLGDLAAQGRLWTCGLVDLEVVYGSRAQDIPEVIDERRALPAAPIDGHVMDRAIQVAGLLAQNGQHRGAKPVDLVTAAAAELFGLAVLHYDSDYDRIGAVTNQPTEWIAPSGTLD